MAAITSAQTGLSNVTSTWVGGVIPVEGDNVTIAATHVVTITGTHIWGNDTATAALTIAGSCVFSTVANTDLTLKGTIVNTGTDAVWQRGTIASPIPSNITSRVRINYSAALANNKYNILFGATTRFAEWSECGATRNRQFQVATAISAGATSITVSNATGWAVGDIIFLEATNTTATQREHRVLTSVSGNVVGWTTGLSNARTAGAWGGNLSSNVLWQSFSGSFGAYVQVICQPTQATATINIKQVATHGLYGQNDVGGFAIGGTNAVTVINSAIGVLDNIAGCDLLPDGTNAVGNSAILGVRAGYSGSWTYPTVYSRQGYTSGLNAAYTSSGGTAYFTNAFFCGVASAIFSQFSQGGVGCKIGNSRITNNQQINAGASMIGFSMDNVTMDGSNYLLGILQGDYTFNNCSFGQTYGFLTTAQLIFNSNNSLSTLDFNNCLVPSTPVVLPSTYQNALVNKPVTFLNKNADPTLQEIYLNTGAITRDNSTLFRSRSSIKFSPYIANTAHGYSFAVSALSGVSTRFKFGLRYDSTYGTATPPSVTISGLGIATQTFTAGGSINTDYSQEIIVTPISTGLLTVTISGQTTSTLGTGNYWFSGMSINPWIDWTQWYGFAYTPTLSTLTIDPVVVLSESAASALSGISFASNTITIASSLTSSNVYDWLKWYEATNRLNPIITSTNGVNFISTANVSITSGSLTGGNITAPSFTLVSAPTNIALTGNVSQATPTNLSGVTITGNLIYNTNTPITVILTNCSISGTVSNSGTGLVTISIDNTTIGTVGSNVSTRPVTSLTLTGLTAGSQIYIADGTGTEVAYIASSGTSYTLDTTGQTGVWSVKVARYGFTSQTGAHLPAIASTTLLITLVADVFITQATKATVAAYTTLGNLDKLYDYAAYYETTNEGIVYARVITKAGTSASAGSYNVTLNNLGSVWSFNGTNLIINSTLTLAGGTTITGSLFTAGTVTLTGLQTNTAITANVLQTTPTNLSGMTITGNLTYNTGSATTVTITNSSISGTISNSGAGAVKVLKAGTSDWFTAGTNVIIRANVNVTASGGLALSTYILKNGSVDLGWVAQNVARTLEIAQADTFSIYAIAYGYKAALVSANALDLNTFQVNLVPEAFIDTSLPTITRDFIASKFSTALDAFNRIALSLDTDLRNYTPDEVMNAIEWYIVTEGDLIAQGVVYAGSIDGVSIINGGILISTPGFYGKVNDSVTTTGPLGILVPIYIDVAPGVYIIDPTYTPVKKNTSGIVLQTAPWTKQTADISAADKAEIATQSSIEVWSAPKRTLNGPVVA